MADPAYIVDGVLTDGEAWVGLATTTLGSDTASITFTSTDDGQVGDFSQYMDLVVVTYGRTATAVAQDNIWMRFGTGGGSVDTTNANYAGQYFQGDGSADTADVEAQPIVGILPAASVTDANVFGGMVSHLFDVNSGKFKSSLHQSACDTDGAGYVWMHAMTWLNQGAITSVQVISKNAGNLKDGSMISLFGVLPRMVAP
jgi:hypothetical protein